MPDEKGRRNGWITIGKIYLVLEMDFRPDGLVYRLTPDNTSTPPLFEAYFFEVVDGRLPPNWIGSTKYKFLSICPSSWLYDGFWEDYFNDQEEAVEIFEREKRIMEEFHSDLSHLTEKPM